MIRKWLAIVLLLIFGQCSSDDPSGKSISVLSMTLNGSSISATGNSNIPVNAALVIVFGSSLDAPSFESQLTITPTVTPTISYSNQSSKVTIAVNFEYETTYTIKIGTGIIGANGERLDKELQIELRTAEDGVIHTMAPCTSATNDCLQTMSIAGAGGSANFDFYSSYPIQEENAEWTNLKYALIVVHGVGRNANDYFSWMTSTLNAENLEDEVVLISPFFKTSAEADAGDYYWSSSGWREGQNSQSTEKLSSFAAVDAIIDLLSDKDHFPLLEKIIIAGHSSGALFTHVYAAANKAETNHTDLDFDYVVANSQFFYYPNDQRIDESDGQLYTPEGCAGYNLWPYGFNTTPSYLSGVTLMDFNNQFKDRAVTYLLGNGSTDDPTLNTTDCSAILLGSTRYQRGENMYSFMEQTYPGNHNQQKVIVEGIGHDGQAMFQSDEFKTLLGSLLGN